jgi:NodT family efflux transporter outer membrane factor (OMF) lipoprotein
MRNKFQFIVIILLMISVWSCSPQKTTIRNENKSVPDSFNGNKDSNTISKINWHQYFGDDILSELIDSALKRNQELNIMMQEIEISKNEIRARKGEYLPFINLRSGAGLDKSGRYTRYGALEDQLDIKPGSKFPEPFTDYLIGSSASWEIDIWKKLRNAKKSAVMNYLASVAGRNFMVTNLIAEIAESYYELMALDNMLDIIDKNIEIQSNALKVVKQQKDAAKVTQLAVNRFEAQLLNTQNLQYAVKQKITETENRINFLTGRYPTRITRNSDKFLNLSLTNIQYGVPAQLLANRPDIIQAEYQLAASKLDVKVARANFYPRIGITAGVGFQAFNPAVLINPESLIYNLAGDLIAPVINRNAIKAMYLSANAKQLQAVYNYERTILNAYVDVLNQLAKIENYNKSFETKQQEVELLKQSVNIANSLFFSARADYAEVLLTQRESLDAIMDIIEIKMNQMNAKVNIYRALGGGWR